MEHSLAIEIKNLWRILNFIISLLLLYDAYDGLRTNTILLQKIINKIQDLIFKIC